MSILGDAARRHIVDGKRFILDAPDHVPAIFGREREVLWAEGESLLIVGPQGVGKTTVLQQLALGRSRVIERELLGYTVKPDERLTLYLALDRPQQIARSFKRMVSDADEQQLAGLVVWKGPLPFNIVKQPERLLELVQEIGAIAGTPVGTVCADSLKDMAAPLSSDEVGAAVARAIGGVVAEGIEFAASHHQRKATSENKKPRALDDVYGSTWISAVAGSVILLWGEPGDPIVELTHLKQPAEEVGPLELSHDHQRGVTTRRDRLDAWTVLQGATSGGVSAADAAQSIFGVTPSKAQVEKVRRRLERFVAEERAVRIEQSGITAPTLYRPTMREQSVSGNVSSPRHAHARSRTPGNTAHATLTPLTNPVNAPHPPLRGGGHDEREHSENGRGGLTVEQAEALAAEYGEVG
jgi:replicative DNA helicase